MGPWLVLLLLPLALSASAKDCFSACRFFSGGAGHSGCSRGGLVGRPLAEKRPAGVPGTGEQDAEKAAALARDPVSVGRSVVRSGEYANATEAWSQAESADAHYNRGNALAHLGEYDAAIAAYDQALAIDPAMEDAVINRELVEQMKEQQEQQQQQQDGDQGDSQNGESSSEQQEGEQAQEGDQQQGEQEGEAQEGEQEGEPQEGEPG